MVRRNWAESWMCGERFAGFTKVVDSSAGPQPQSHKGVVTKEGGEGGAV